MSTSSNANPDASRASSGRRQHFELAKNAMAVLVVLVLLYLGQRGRREATANAKVDHQGRVRQKQTSVPADRSLAPSIISGSATTTNVSTNVSSVESLFVRAGERLIAEDFDAALQSYQDAVNVISNQIAQGTSGMAAVQLATALEGRGNVFLVQGKPDVAVAEYENSVAILSQLAQAGEGEAVSALARVHFICGNACFILRRNDLATNHFNRAISILTEMPKTAGLEVEIAMAQNCVGNVLLMQRKTEAAISKYDAAIAQLAESSNENRNYAPMELGSFRNNKGVALRLSGQVNEALVDFGSAIELLTEATEVAEMNHTNTGQSHTATRVHVDVMMGYADKGFDISMRTRIGEMGREKHAEIALAIAHRNRGFTRLGEGEPGGAVEDFRTGMELFRKLVEKEDQRDLTSQLVKSLSSLAWVLAVSADDSIRDGKAAKELATRACELSDWRVVAALEALGAALAETGDFGGAVKWQGQAAELLSPAQKGEAVQRLELYKAGKPFRTGFASEVDFKN